MRRIVFDIETCAYPFESLAESQKEYLLRYADKEPDPEKRQMMIDDAVRYTSLYPYTSKCIVIGIYDVEKEKSFVYYENETKSEWTSESTTGGGEVQYKGLPEKEMLESFWRIAKQVDQFITFNGRNFDVPFLMMRSAMLGVKVTKNLMGYRFT
jgi:DNA polymerase elongation subunit (family B)